jgi:uncharacterized membrane protein
MTYSPGSPGYPPANQPTNQFSAPTQHFGKPDLGQGGAEGPSKLPSYLLMAVAALGLLIYLANFGPIFQVTASDFLGQGGTVSGSTLGIGIAVIAGLLAGLLAAVSLLPKQRNHVAVVAAIAVLSFLLVIAELINKPSEASIGWALYVLIALSLLQAASAIASLLYDAGILNPPTPRPKYDQQQQQQYGQYGAPASYYGQPQHQQHQQPQHHLGQQGGQPHQQSGQQQRPGYPSQYGGYSAGPNTGGFPASGAQSGPPTPPTGFPTYGQPQQQQPGSGQTTQGQQPQSSSQQSGPTPS